MPPPERVLICALSGRALAEAARAAGYAPIVLDAFGDLDTREAAVAWQRIPITRHWLLRRRPLLAAAARLAPPPIPLVWGSGFERAPGLLAELSAGRELWGCDAETVRALKDPRGFSATARGLGVPHPEVRFSRPRAATGWLVKRAGSAGGGHVRAASTRPPAGRGWYWQRRAPGTPHSAFMVGNGRDARVLGLGRQLVAPASGRPFRFGGTLAPVSLAPVPARRASDAAAALAAHYRVRGLASVDLLVHGDEIVVLELNPRPGASLDAQRRSLGCDLFAIHVAACRGEQFLDVTGTRDTFASLIVHVDRSLVVPEGLTWPDWAADRSPSGTRIPRGGPVCTVLSEGEDARTVERSLQARAERVLAIMGAGNHADRRAVSA